MSASRLEQLLQLLREDPGDSFVRYALGLEHIGRGQHREALTYLEELRRRDPAYLPTYYQLGALYEEVGREEDAIEAYRAGLEIGRRQNDLHTVSELQAALDELE